jgi:hypothetical protein
VESARQGIEVLIWKIGLGLLVLGGMHFIKLLIFSWTHGRPKGLRSPVQRESVVEAG